MKAVLQPCLARAMLQSAAAAGIDLPVPTKFPAESTSILTAFNAIHSNIGRTS